MTDSTRRATSINARKIDSGVEPGLFQEVDQVLGADVAGGARRERASAEAGDRRLELAHAEVEPDHHVGESHAARVVEVERDRKLRMTLARIASTRRATVGGVAMPVVSPSVSASNPSSA